MGAVHGVHLKYVAASALCSVCAYHAGPDGERIMPLRSLLVYSAATHGLFAGLFVARVGMGILGKQRAAGVVPWWSYLVWAPFHSFTYLYTYFHTLHSEAHGTPVATEVAPGWWIGGRYAHWRMPERRWRRPLDLTPTAAAPLSKLCPQPFLQVGGHHRPDVRVPGRVDPQHVKLPPHPLLGRRPSDAGADRGGGAAGGASVRPRGRDGALRARARPIHHGDARLPGPGRALLGLEGRF